MKILFVIPTYIPAWKYGGVATAVHSLVQELVFQGVDVTVYSTDAGLPDSYEGKQKGFCLLNGVKVHYFKCDCESPILSRTLSEATRKTIGSFDLMYLAAVWQPLSIAVRRAAVEAGCPYVLAPHGALDAWPIRYKRLKKTLYYLLVERTNIRCASAFSYCSSMELEGASRFARNSQILCNIPNGLDFGQWVRDDVRAKRWRAEIGIEDSTFLFLNVGRLHHKKGLDLVIRALAPLRAQDWHLSFVGNDEDGTRAKLSRLVMKLGLAERVTFHPSVSPEYLPTIYSAGNLFILPSYHENFGNVVLEALACECPVLVSDQVGVYKDLLGIRGVQVRKRDVALWSEALACSLNGEEEFKSNGGDRQELERRFAIRNCATEMKEFYRSVIARRGVMP